MMSCILQAENPNISTMWRISYLLFACMIADTSVNGFVLDSIDMTDATFEQCSFCDERSDRAGSRAVADALREYMTQNHVNILLEQGT